MTELPEMLTSGEPARLFPTIAESGKERKAISILLSSMRVVRPLADSMMAQLGKWTGKRTKVATFTEVVFKTGSSEKSKDRPDGLIVVINGKNRWTCLVEAKIGKTELDADQVDRYLKLARDNGIDAVLTISNQFAPLPTHHPLAGLVKPPRRVEMFHLSWRAILTEAVHLRDSIVIDDPEHAFVISEFCRFFSHPSAGVAGFTSMPSEWSTVIDKIQAGGKPLKAEAESIVGAWHQELRDLTLQMSAIVGRHITVKLKPKARAGAKDRMAAETEILCEQRNLEATITIPDAAAPLKVVADLQTRSLRIGMELEAPRDKARTSSRVKWLLRQMKDVTRDDIVIGLVWASRAATNLVPLAELRTDPKMTDALNQNSELRALEVTLVSNSVRRFSGVRTFIEELESLAPLFYEDIGQKLGAWTPSAPKPKVSVKTEPEDQPDVSIADTSDGEKSHSQAS